MLKECVDYVWTWNGVTIGAQQNVVAPAFNNDQFDFHDTRMMQLIVNMCLQVGSLYFMFSQ